MKGGSGLKDKMDKTALYGQKDQSFDIDTSSAQTGTCPQCMAEFSLPALRKHIAEECPNRPKRCPEVGCGAMIIPSELKRHLERECRVAKEKRFMVAQAAYRKEQEEKDQLAKARLDEERIDKIREELREQYLGKIVEEEAEHRIEISHEGEIEPIDKVDTFHMECPLCNVVIKKVDLKVHQKRECGSRLVYCTNRSLGCQEEVCFNQLSNHIKSTCWVERKKDEMIARSHLRREPIVCPGCGKPIALMDFKRHEAQYCENRKVPCRNACLGCQVMVRLKDRGKHEYVDGTFKQRSCLYSAGGDTHILIGEDDIPPPWTAEYWIYRPSLQESARRHIMGVMNKRKVFRKAFVKEREINEKVLALTDRLNHLAKNMPGSSVVEINEVRMQIIEEIADLVFIYENIAIASVEASCQLDITFNTVIPQLRQMIASETVQEQVTLPCRPPGVQENEALLMQKERQRKLTEMKEIKSRGDTPVSAVAGGSLVGTLSAPSTAQGARPSSVSIPEGEVLRSGSAAKSIADSGGLGSTAPGTAASNASSAKPPRLERRASEAAAVGSVPDTAPRTGSAADLESTTSSITASQAPSVRGSAPGEAFAEANTSDCVPATAPETDAPVDVEVDRTATVDLEEDEEDDEDEDDEFKEIAPAEDAEPVDSVFLAKDPVIFPGDAKTWVGWQEYVLTLKQSFMSELLTLNSWRVSAGLSKNDHDGGSDSDTNSKKSTKSSKKSKDKTKSKEKQAKDRKKEKERKRRELKAKGNMSGNVTEGPKFRHRVVDTTKVNRGTDVIAASARCHNALCLHLEEDFVKPETDGKATDSSATPLLDISAMSGGKVGFVSQEDGAFAFAVSIPRQQWVHVAYVCTRKPKKRISLYVDGRFSGHAKDRCFPFPLHAIGKHTTNTNDSFHGCLLDIRLWNKARSAAEIRYCMNRLIELVDNKPKTVDKRSRHQSRASSPVMAPGADDDEAEESSKIATVSINRGKSRGGKRNVKKVVAPLDSTSDGMIGWWTFEDSSGNLITDVSERRFRTPVLSANGKKVEPPVEENVATDRPHSTPLPSALNALDTPSSIESYQPNNSFETFDTTLSMSTFEPMQSQFLADNSQYTIFNPYIPQCTPYQWMDADKVPLSSAGRKMAESRGGTAEDKYPTKKPGSSHSKKESAPTDAEEGGIDSLLPLPSFRESVVCPFELRRFRLAVRGRALLREAECPLGCDDKIRQIDVRFHVAFQCRFRIMKCKYDFCDAEFRTCDQAIHEADPEACAYLRSRDRLIDRAERSNKLVGCPDCSEQIRVRDLADHRLHACAFRSVFCPREDCKKTMPANRLEDHLKYYCESCMVDRHVWLIKRARQRLNYPRPWGIEIPLVDDDASSVESA